MDTSTPAFSPDRRESHSGPERASTRSWRKLAVLLIAFPPIALLGVYLLLQGCMRYLASLDHTPNQGAMVVAFLVFVAAAVVTAVAMVTGVVMLVMSLRRPSRGPADPRQGVTRIGDDHGAGG